MTTRAALHLTVLALACSFASLPQEVHAITPTELDAFPTDVEGWSQGAPGGVTHQPTGGPVGANDPYMRVQSTGGGQSLGKLVVYNQTPTWTGDYLTAGVTAISMDVNNLGATPLVLRLALGTSSAPNVGGDWIVTTVGKSLPAASGWTSVEFPLGANDFTGDPFLNVIDDVVTLRIFHAVSPNTSGVGEAIAATLGVDNIRAIGSGSIVPGDFNGVGGVEATDLEKWRDDFSGAGSDADGDLDSDGDDLLIWQRNLGQGTSVAAAAAVPEPAGSALIAMAMLLATTHLRRISTGASR